ncbi:UPF0223 family protein [Lactobacillus sp. LC28-10]|uniref:UPF0223 family protein n=1 Tax=Secundilactobacillus angelensis TaxID=2722706 RepID=A0ABX1KUQ7_9LACO|nr:UPF0223 family protein [Secundilactobacillus angelensis]NLR17657.1 UPF0223 family protein [Secundilactobacillus angelensis]
MLKNFSYPLEQDWSTDEIVTVTTFYRQIEDAYELSQGVTVDALLSAYSAFKQIVPSKSQEKRLGKQFERLTGYSWYQTLKTARETSKKSVKMTIGG